MKICLVFPPRSSPTYLPLGLACLTAIAQRTNASVDLLDANLELWNQLCNTTPLLDDMRKFSHGSMDDFLNEHIYTARWRPIANGTQKIKELETLSHHYLEGNGLASPLQTVLARWANRISRNSPDKIGFSVMYLDQLAFALSSAKYLRENDFTGTIWLGGAAMSALSPEKLLEAAPFLDAILIGEGENSILRLLEGKDWKEIPGCYARTADHSIFHTCPEPAMDLNLLPMPDFRPLLGGGYFNPLPVLPIYGCRGCKWRRCRFCTHNRSFGSYRTRSPMVVAQEMLKNRIACGCRHYYFVDQYVDPFYLDALSDAIFSLGLDCRFEIMARTIPEYTPALLAKAAHAGLCWIGWGMESGSQKMLDHMNKGTRIAPAERVIRDADALGISNLLMMIFGAPGSRRESMEETFSFLERIWDHIDGMTASAFVLFAHTAFSRNAEKYGLEILGNNPILKLGSRIISDGKQPFRRVGESGSGESPLAAQEIAEWEKRKIWLPPLPFHGKLCCEHYLLYADARMQSGSRPNPTGLRTA